MTFTKRIEEILEDSLNLNMDDRLESDIFSYFQFLEFFKNRTLISLHDFTIAAYFSYGWMPTILSLDFINKDEDCKNIVEYMNMVKEGKILNETQLETMKRVVNNSIIGVSKLLHFANPSVYPIWDSRVANYFGIKSANKVKLYIEYQKFCRSLDKEKVSKIHSNVVERIASFKEATELRTLEFVFFNKGKRHLQLKDK